MNDLAFAFRNCLDHGIEACRKPADLVVGFGLQYGFFAAAELPDGIVKRGQRFGNAACDPPPKCHDQRQSQCTDQHDQIFQHGIFRHRRCQRMAQHEARIQSILQAWKNADPEEISGFVVCFDHGPRRL